MTDGNIIETARLVLRPPRLADGTVVTGYLNDEATSRLLARVPYPYTLDNWRWFFANVIEKREESVYAITLKGRDPLMGIISHLPDEAEPNTFHIGFWLGKPYRRRGIMEEAVQAILRHGFANPSVVAATSGYFADNVASEALHRKFGFEPVGGGAKVSIARGADPVPHVDVRLAREKWNGA